jgi:DNA modification methylase
MTDANGLAAIKHGEVTRLGWQPPTQEMTDAEWLDLGKQITTVDQSMQWMIGDWWAYGTTRKYGDGRALAAAVGIDYQAVHVLATVSRAYEILTRVKNLSFKHHQLVAKRDDRHEWLQRAATGDIDPTTGETKPWSTRRLNDEVKAFNQAQRDLDRAHKTGGTATITHADSLQWLQSIDTASVDLLLTDPPYATDITDIATFATWVDEAMRCIKPTGRAVIFHGRYPQEVRAYLDAADRIGWTYELAAWHYADTMGPNPTGRLKTSHQMILIIHGPDADDLYTEQLIDKQSCWVNAMNQEAGGRHFAWQKPQALAERLVTTFAPPDGTIIDPYAGAGTFLIAAAALGRHATGCDINQQRLTDAQHRGIELAA